MHASLIWTALMSTFDLPPGLSPTGAPPLEVDYTSTFQKRNARVRRAMLSFNPAPQLVTSQPPSSSPFDVYERQVLRGLSGPMADTTSLSAGIALFAAMTVIAARAPEPIRVLFDGPARIGPAILRDGGFGAGFGYRW